jgi:PIN domain nuclease of toxin-antitoxin system
VKLLLDSHVILWALYDPPMLPDGVNLLIRDPANEVFVSEGSVWELMDKAMKGRLPLIANSASRFVDDILALGATLLPIERDDILRSVDLPFHHGDPFDRMFIAQAQARDLTLISKDRDIAKYDIKFLWK